jgi:Family of unknown function (DUF6504)
MRRYDDTIEVRRGLVNGTEAPEQFLWRGRLWLVHDVMAHWIETGPWWEQREAQAVLGTDAGSVPGVPSSPGQRGIFDLVFDWGAGSWRLQHSVD